MAAEELALDANEPVAAEAAPKPKPRTNWWEEIKGIVWLVLAVLGFHSFIAKPFYIPSESMLPGLLVGDRLVVTKYPYGWSFVSPTFHLLPFFHGRLFGQLPERGDVVIVTPPGTKTDYIKRVIGLPGDRLQVRGGVVFLNGVAVKRGPVHFIDIPDYGGVMMQDGHETCEAMQYDGGRLTGADGKQHCRLPLVTETLPNGRSYETVDLQPDSQGDNYGPVTIPAKHVFLMGDNRDRSSDSRFSLSDLGLGGPVPWEYVGGRAEFITFSPDGSATLNPLTWWGSLRSGRAGTSLHPREETK
ncbi:signal peptidase I [Sphingomonas sp. So64.6b]|uniref:signal peptidase I n=1 Tax=Sphingomonas sp. So64.6b TaxID=2997354 RepID=UPI00160286AA|nr:signal peptidase I [Sphingomonas sp. So64.6b]